MKHFAILWLLAIQLMGCAYYKKQVCSSETLTDIPNFEGSFNYTAIDPTTLQIQRSVFQIHRTAKGVYSYSAAQMYTCEIDHETYMETASDNTSVPGYSLQKLIRQADGSFDFAMLSADPTVLDAKKIPYQIIETDEFPLLGRFSGADGAQKNKVLSIDNSKLSSSEFTQLLNQLSLKVTIYPEWAAAKKSKPAK